MNQCDSFPEITTIQSSTPTATKQHSCTICGQPIWPGQCHNKLVYRDDTSLDRRTALKSVRYHFQCPPAW